jgi:hypothetical protein
MRRRAIEDIGDGFALVGRQRCDVHERLHPIIMDRSDHGAGISMPCQDDRASSPLDHASKSSGVIRE